MIVRFLVWFVAICSLVLAGCGENVVPLSKYDNKTSNLKNNAVVVIAVKNASFLDLTEYTDLSQKNDATKQIRHKVVSVPAQATQPVSANPNTDYKGNRYDLRRVFAKDDQNNEAVNNQDNNQTKTAIESRNEEIRTENQTDVNLTKGYRIHKPSSFFNLFSYAKCTYILKPGVYYISFAYYDPSMDSNPNLDTDFTRLPGVNAKGVVQYGAFKVKAGDVLYIGDITLDWVDQSKPNFVTLTGNITDVKKDLKAAGEIEISNKITQAVFYKAGAKIARSPDNNGFTLD